jgi:hypothetical protein
MILKGTETQTDESIPQEVDIDVGLSAGGERAKL